MIIFFRAYFAAMLTMLSITLISFSIEGKEFLILSASLSPPYRLPARLSVCLPLLSLVLKLLKFSGKRNSTSNSTLWVMKPASHFMWCIYSLQVRGKSNIEYFLNKKILWNNHPSFILQYIISKENIKTNPSHLCS